MKLSAEKLASHAAKGLQPLYVLAGDEPLLVDEALAIIRERAARDGCGERESYIAERSFDWAAFAAGLKNLSLFASRRLVELRLPTGRPGTSGAEFLTALAARPDTGNVIVLLLPALDSQSARSRWATTLAGAATWIELRSPATGELPAWLGRRLQQAGLQADEAAIDLLASRVEGNLLAAKQEIDKLVLLVAGGHVTSEAIRDSVADGARYDIFQLCDAALAGDTARVVRVLRGLQREGESAVLLLWNLARDIVTLTHVLDHVSRGRQLDEALQAAGVWRSRQHLFRRAAQGRNLQDAGRLVRCAARADQIVKGIDTQINGVPTHDSWNALLEVSVALSGTRMPLAETG